MSPLVLVLVANVCVAHSHPSTEVTVTVCTHHEIKLGREKFRECAYRDARLDLVHNMLADEDFSLPEGATIDAKCRLVRPGDSTNMADNIG